MPLEPAIADYHAAARIAPEGERGDLLLGVRVEKGGAQRTKRKTASNLMACRGRPVEYGYVAEVILH